MYLSYYKCNNKCFLMYQRMIFPPHTLLPPCSIILSLPTLSYYWLLHAEHFSDFPLFIWSVFPLHLVNFNLILEQPSSEDVSVWNGSNGMYCSCFVGVCATASPEMFHFRSANLIKEVQTWQYSPNTLSDVCVCVFSFSMSVYTCVHTVVCLCVSVNNCFIM